MQIPAKKSLGQNFLKSKVALAKMIEAGEVNNTDIILEVGPGKGILTEKLLAVAKKVIAVEKDDRLIELLQEKFAEEIKENKLELVHGDILDFDQVSYSLLQNKYKIIANIPYYITGQFLRKFLATPSLKDSVARSARSGFRETDNQPSKIVVMVQKEIADRIIARDPKNQTSNKENLLSLSVKAFGEPKKIMKVDKENFSPAPKVDSAILLINNISKKFFIENNISEESFFKLIHVGFAHKRKMLIGNLRGEISKNKNLPGIFSKIKIPTQARSEDLNLNDWVNLLTELQP